MTTHTTRQASITAEDIIAAAKSLMANLASLPDDPITAKMKADGCDPRDGWMLVMPDKHRVPGLPRHVIFSPYAQSPVYIMDLWRHRESAVPY